MKRTKARRVWLVFDAIGTSAAMFFARPPGIAGDAAVEFREVLPKRRPTRKAKP